MASILSDKPEIELLDGRAYPKVSPKAKHAGVQGAIWRVIEDLAGDSGFVGPEWRFKIGRADDTNTTFVPEVSLIYRSNISTRPPKKQAEPPPFPAYVAERAPSHPDSPPLRRKRKASCKHAAECFSFPTRTRARYSRTARPA